jgi:hypothetical protein
MITESARDPAGDKLTRRESGDLPESVQVFARLRTGCGVPEF